MVSLKFNTKKIKEKNDDVEIDSFFRQDTTSPYPGEPSEISENFSGKSRNFESKMMSLKNKAMDDFGEYKSK